LCVECKHVLFYFLITSSPCGDLHILYLNIPLFSYAAHWGSWSYYTVELSFSNDNSKGL
jgi:hypothetical protein